VLIQSLPAFQLRWMPKRNCSGFLYSAGRCGLEAHRGRSVQSIPCSGGIKKSQETHEGRHFPGCFSRKGLAAQTESCCHLNRRFFACSQDSNSHCTGYDQRQRADSSQRRLAHSRRPNRGEGGRAALHRKLSPWVSSRIVSTGARSLSARISDQLLSSPAKKNRNNLSH